MTAMTNEMTARSDPALTPEQVVRLAVFRAVYTSSKSYPSIETEVTRWSDLILGSPPSQPEDTRG